MNATGPYWWQDNIGSIRQQAITWANVDLDLCCQMVSLGLNELTTAIYVTNGPKQEFHKDMSISVNFNFQQEKWR